MSGHHVDGKDVGVRAKKQGYEYHYISENVCYYYANNDIGNHRLAGEIMEGWIESEGHNENMLSCNVSEIGVGVASRKKGDTYHYYAVQVFGSPSY